MTHLQARNISVRIGQRTILDNVSASFERGKVTAIVGPNGTGKSTFLDCLAQIRTPQSGTVTLDDKDLSRVPARIRARQMAYLPQNAEIAWDVDCETFVGLGRTPYTGAWGLSAEDLEQVAKAILITGTATFKNRVVTTLSGGERARIMIARALAGNPDWLLADEPLAGLDPGHVLDVGDLFRHLAHERGYGILVTLHDLSAALRMADRVIVLAEGNIIADDEPIQALTPDILRRAYGVESRVLSGENGPVLEVIARHLA